MGWLLLPHCEYQEAKEHPDGEISEVVSGHTMQRPSCQAKAPETSLRKAEMGQGAWMRKKEPQKARKEESKVQEMGETVQSTECARENVEAEQDEKENMENKKKIRMGGKKRGIICNKSQQSPNTWSLSLFQGHL